MNKMKINLKLDMNEKSNYEKRNATEIYHVIYTSFLVLVLMCVEREREREREMCNLEYILLQYWADGNVGPRAKVIGNIGQRTTAV